MVKRRIVKVLSMPDLMIKAVIKMGKKSKQTRSAETLQFLNHHREKYDWDNDKLEIDEGLGEDEVHPDLPVEIPGVSLSRPK